MFPKDAITESVEITNIGDFDFDNGSARPKTILGVSIHQSGIQSDSTFLCGSNEVAKNFATNFSFNALNYRCNEVVSANKTGAGDSAFFIITYVPYNTSSGTTSPTFINGFSYDGIVIGFLLFLMFCIMFFGGIWNKAIGIKTKRDISNEIIGNNSQDGKVIYYD